MTADRITKLMENPVLYYVHDPMCSWCWGFRSTFEQLSSALPKDVKLVKVLGGLAPDTDVMMPMQMQQHIQQTWKRIEEKIPGVHFNFDFWQKCQPRRSTYPACRAVIAAGIQNEKYKDVMIAAIQTAYYQRALNPSEHSVLIQLARENELDPVVFLQDLVSEKVEQMLQSEISTADKLPVSSFPSLVLQLNGAYRPIAVDYLNHESMLETINSLTGC